MKLVGSLKANGRYVYERMDGSLYYMQNRARKDVHGNHKILYDSNRKRRRGQVMVRQAGKKYKGHVEELRDGCMLVRYDEYDHGTHPEWYDEHTKRLRHPCLNSYPSIAAPAIVLPTMSAAVREWSESFMVEGKLLAIEIIEKNVDRLHAAFEMIVPKSVARPLKVDVAAMVKDLTNARSQHTYQDVWGYRSPERHLIYVTQQKHPTCHRRIAHRDACTTRFKVRSMSPAAAGGLAN